MLSQKTEDEIRQALYDDPRTVTEQLESIFHDKTSKWHQAYFNSRDPQHDEAVQRVQILAAAKHPGMEVEPMPVITHTGENTHQADETYSLGDDICSWMDDKRED